MNDMTEEKYLRTLDLALELEKTLVDLLRLLSDSMNEREFQGRRMFRRTPKPKPPIKIPSPPRLRSHFLRFYANKLLKNY